VSLKAIKKETVDTIYLASTLYYKNGEKTSWDSIPMKVRARGAIPQGELLLCSDEDQVKKG
jgi:hypothetical protein